LVGEAAPAVEAEGLTLSYGERKALDGVSLRVPRGEIFALLGPNGGGKTTLFRILSTSLPPDSGSLRIDGLDAARERREVRRRLGVVFQAPSLDRKLSVLENLSCQGRLYGLSGREIASRSRELLEALRLSDRASDLVETLSGGLARRAEIAKALLHRPPVLLLDEPSTGLDPGARKDLRELLARLSGEGTAVLLTTHLFEEAEAADRIGLLDHGRLVGLGTPAELKSAVGGDVIAVATSGPEEAAALAREVRERFGADAGKVGSVDASVRLERKEAHAFVPRLVEAFPGRFRSLTIGEPTLEDAFVDLTGHGFREREEIHW